MILTQTFYELYNPCLVALLNCIKACASLHFPLSSAMRPVIVLVPLELHQQIQARAADKDRSLEAMTRHPNPPNYPPRRRENPPLLHRRLAAFKPSDVLAANDLRTLLHMVELYRKPKTSVNDEMYRVEMIDLIEKKIVQVLTKK